MKYERHVVSRIVSELMNFFFSMGARDFSSHVIRNEDRFEICVESDYAGNPTTKIREMTRLLRMPRAREMEEYSWSLSGDISTGQEIYLVGIMTDDVTVEHDEEAGRVRICLTRLLE
ncbi:MAG TPA: hypothetical protein P5201_01135 [Aminobacteriaceae bacterium]|nr:hypothetical protein [Aminobacteriaceae bacterium]